MTLTDFYRKVLEKLKVAAAGESADADDTQLISDKYTAVYDMLLTKGLVSWTATEDLPSFAVIPLTAMVAWTAADEFGIDANVYAAEGGIDLPQLSLAEQQLRRQLAKSVVSYPATPDYF